MSSECRLIVVGSGAAGLTAAHETSPASRKVAVDLQGRAQPKALPDWAQGGIAAVLEEGDTFEAHVNDTMIGRRRSQ
jgi:L-aspartate oxidase